MNQNSRYIRWFKDIQIEDVQLVGGKNASLGEMYRELTGLGVKIPNGFAVTPWDSAMVRCALKGERSVIFLSVCHKPFLKRRHWYLYLHPFQEPATGPAHLLFHTFSHDVFIGDHGPHREHAHASPVPLVPESGKVLHGDNTGHIPEGGGVVGVVAGIPPAFRFWRGDLPCKPLAS